MSCFRLLWCVLQLQWGRPLYQHPVPIHPSPKRSRVLRWGDGWVETGCCEQTVLNKTGQTVRHPTIRYRFLQLAFYHLNQAFLYKKRSKLNQSKLQKENIVIVVSCTRPANVGARCMLYQTDQTHARPDHTPKHLSGHVVLYNSNYIGLLGLVYARHTQQATQLAHLSSRYRITTLSGSRFSS